MLPPKLLSTKIFSTEIILAPDPRGKDVLAKSKKYFIPRHPCLGGWGGESWEWRGARVQRACCGARAARAWRRKVVNGNTPPAQKEKGWPSGSGEHKSHVGGEDGWHPSDHIRRIRLRRRWVFGMSQTGRAWGFGQSSVTGPVRPPEQVAPIRPH
jgi:hypothetical protein